ncbi:tetratricopeptide repeat-containing sulfotransferase family protein [Alteromonas gilva]|uniref:Sulfotransferase n=1 Tax=Alteromonas gilva TaxID=2987522 RepID=A0ABT5L4N8_9ALTE|nr:tetratricopeptide repeat-containing sulfotransferase family protein [Alteromonas gilva]MDC8830827.1 sulfotransferase [Alteromonas gilva]
MTTQDFQQQINAIKRAVQGSQLSQATAMVEQLKARSLVAAQRVEVLYLAAVINRLSGSHAAAISELNELLALRPDHGRAFQELAYNHQATGDAQQAASAFYRATHYNPALLASWKQLLAIYRQHNDAAAEQLASQQIDYLQGLPPPVLGAYDLMYEKQLGAAEQVCRQFLQQNKHHPEAMLLLAELGIQHKVYHDAEFLLESCVELYPDNLRAVISYLSLLAKLGKHQKVVTISDKQLSRFTDNLQIMMARANALLGLNQTAQAVDMFNALLASDADRPAVWLALGHAYKTTGDTDKATHAYLQAAHYHPQFGDAYWSLANMKSYRFDDQSLAEMVTIAQQPSISIEDNIHLCFALGKGFEDSQDYEKSFAYYSKGNHLKLHSVQYDIRRAEQAIEAQMKACQPELFSAKSGGFPAPDPIFIVGMPRAGSTLLEQILASHSDIDGTMELHNILSLASSVSGQKKPYPFCLADLSTEQCYQLGKQYIEQTRYYRGTGSFFIDKMPNNFMHIGFIKRILPNAKIIDARRDPIDCCFSNFKQLFGEGQEFSYGLDEVARYYKAYIKLMDHWESVLSGEVLRVQHEDVLDDLEGQVKRMLDYLGVPFEPGCLNFHQTERLIKTPSAEQVRQPINRQGQGRWQPYQAQLAPLLKHFDNA